MAACAVLVCASALALTGACVLANRYLPGSLNSYFWKELSHD
jgi:hypothetical protein